MKIKERVPEIGAGGTGEMTTDHSANSYGMPVAVFGGVAYGAGEIGPLVALEDDAEMLEAARRAGYQIEAEPARRSDPSQLSLPNDFKPESDFDREIRDRGMGG